MSLDALRRDESEGLLSHLVNQRARLYAILDLAEDQDFKVAAAIHARLSRHTRTNGQACLIGLADIQRPFGENNLVIAPEYLALRAALLKALAPPEFRAARQAGVSRPTRYRGKAAGT